MPQINFSIAKKSFPFDIEKKEIYNPKHGEILKIINNTNELYGITNYGRVISLKYNIVLKPRINRDGYLYNCIRVNNKNVYVKPHCLVAKYFIDNPNNYNCVNHKDENKTNNIVSNLEWCDIKYNNSYGNRLEKVSKSSGTPIDVYKDGKYICTENSISACIKKYHVGTNNIISQLKRIRKKWYRDTCEYYFAYKGQRPIKDIIKEDINNKATFSFNTNKHDI